MDASRWYPRDHAMGIERTLRYGAGAALGLALSLLAPDAGAQSAPPEPATDPSADATTRARVQFDTGLEAARRNDWDRAREAFARAYSLAPRPLVLLNLAGAQLQSGHLVDAADNYRLFLHLEPAEAARSYTAEAERALREVERRLPHVRVRIESLRAQDQVLLDERAIDPSADLEHPVDPGEHRVRVVRAGSEIARAQLLAREGQSHTVVISLPRIPSMAGPGASVARRDRADAGPSHRVLTPSAARSGPSPWPWVVLGAVVLGGAAVTLGVLVATSSDGGYHGNLPPGRVSLQ